MAQVPYNSGLARALRNTDLKSRLAARMAAQLLASILFATLAGCASVTIEKSPNDTRAYRYLTLQNQMKVLLISDDAADTAAASLVVARGSYHEPLEYAGLAHFLEHMLFIGTAKYPDVDGYQQYVSTHGGTTNAYTAGDHTNYFFDISPAQLEPALDRFAEFFISPLLAEQYVDREKNAVNSEYQLQIKDDGWRSSAVRKIAQNPEHPSSRFTIGSLGTLGDGVREALVEFFQSNYSADQMALVVMSNHDLDTLEAQVRPLFEPIEDRGIGQAPPYLPQFLDSQLPKVLSYRTLKNTRRVTYNFPVPSIDPYFGEKPLEYLNNLLGHEGEGSLHANLKARGWIESLGAGGGRLDTSNAMVSIGVTLTEQGAQHIDEISTALFGYIDLLADNGPEAWRYAEQAKVSELAFRYQEQASPIRFVYATAPNLFQYPPAQTLSAPYLMRSFDAPLISDYLSYLRRDNVLVEVSGPDVDTDRVEPWFDVPFKLADAPALAGSNEAEHTWAQELALPQANPFLPEGLVLLAGDSALPSVVIDEPGLTVWLDTDTHFKAPRAQLMLKVAVDGGLKGPRDVVLAAMYQRLLQDALNTYAYPAQLAGLSYRVGSGVAGFHITIAGYNDKQPELLASVLDTFGNLHLDATRFDLYQQELIRNWDNFRAERPYSQAQASLNNLLLSNSWPPTRLADTAREVTLTELERWRAARLDGVRVVALLHGNLNMRDAEQIAELLRSALRLDQIPVAAPTVATVDRASRLLVPVDHGDAAIVIYVQGRGSAKFEERARFALTAHLLGSAFFTELRTNRQLGYVVGASNRAIRDRAGMAFIIQSPVASPADLETAIAQFLVSYRDTLAAMPPAEFEEFKDGLVNELTQSDKSLYQRSQRLWLDLDLDVTTFDSRSQIASAVARQSLPELTKFYDELLVRFDKRRLVIYTMGRFTDAPSHGVPLKDASAFKSRTTSR